MSLFFLCFLLVQVRGVSFWFFGSDSKVSWYIDESVDRLKKYSKSDSRLTYHLSLNQWRSISLTQLGSYRNWWCFKSGHTLQISANVSLKMAEIKRKRDNRPPSASTVCRTDFLSNAFPHKRISPEAIRSFDFSKSCGVSYSKSRYQARLRNLWRDARCSLFSYKPWTSQWPQLRYSCRLCPGGLDPGQCCGIKVATPSQCKNFDIDARFVAPWHVGILEQSNNSLEAMLDGLVAKWSVED